MTTNFAKDHLRSFVERVERLEAEKAALAGDIREVYAEAKGHGFNTKIIRKVVARRKLSADQRDEEAALLDLYMTAVEVMAAHPPRPLAQAAE